MRGLPTILSLFRNQFIKFNKTGARMLDSIYHMALILFYNLISGVKKSLYTQRYGRHNVMGYATRKSVNH